MPRPNIIAVLGAKLILRALEIFQRSLHAEEKRHAERDFEQASAKSSCSVARRSVPLGATCPYMAAFFRASCCMKRGGARTRATAVASGCVDPIQFQHAKPLAVPVPASDR